MKAHISVPAIKNLKPAGKPYEVVDDNLKGFLARVQPTGVITYYFAYRTRDGLKHRYRIGRHPGITAVAARKAAEKLAAEVIQNTDPHQDRKTARQKASRAKQETLGGFIELKYKSWALAHQKRGNETLDLLEGNFKDFYGKKMIQITAWDIQKWRSDKGKAGLKPSSINRRVTSLKAVLNKAVEWDVIATNPLQKIKPLKIDQKSRIRYLSKDEEKRLRDALDVREQEIRQGRESGNQWRNTRNYKQLPPMNAAFVDYLKPMVLLCMNTGLRRGELFNLRWADVSFPRKQLTVEGTTSKSGQTRHVDLNSDAMTLLVQWKAQAEGDYVFTSPVSGERFNNIKKSC